MHLDRYEYTVDRFLLDYEFTSSGPNGNIRKLLSFVPINEGGKTFYNKLFFMPGRSDKKAEFTSFGTRIHDHVVRHSYSPSFQKKADQAKKMIEKAGFPELPKDEKKSK